MAIHICIHSGFAPKESTTALVDFTSSSLHGLFAVFEVWISKYSCQYARVTQLNHFKQLNISFSLLENTSATAAPFSITANDGIVFVSNAYLLSMIEVDVVTLNIVWRINTNNGETIRNSSILNINITDKDQTESSSCNSEVLCAEFRTEEDCHQAKGAIASTDNRGCSWRKDEKKPSSQYQTCSVDLITCPDGNCDDLESLYWSICPQDCTGNILLILQVHCLAFKIFCITLLFIY